MVDKIWNPRRHQRRCCLHLSGTTVSGWFIYTDPSFFVSAWNTQNLLWENVCCKMIFNPLPYPILEALPIPDHSNTLISCSNITICNSRTLDSETILARNKNQRIVQRHLEQANFGLWHWFQEQEPEDYAATSGTANLWTVTLFPGTGTRGLCSDIRNSRTLDSDTVSRNKIQRIVQRHHIQEHQGLRQQHQGLQK